MTKAEIIETVMKGTGLQKLEVVVAFEAIIDTMKTAMSKGENIYLRGFGTFNITMAAAKKARIINENKFVVVPAHKVVKFKPSPELNELVK